MAQLPAENSTLARAVRRAAEQGRLSHAIVLSGDGDLLDAARFIAASHVCEEESKPCLRCRHCRKVFQGAFPGIHPDVALVERAADKSGKLRREITVDQIRALAVDAAVLPNEADGKVYIFPEADTMNIAAQNAFLKLLEEPPRGVMFLLCAESREKLLETVQSRCGEIRLAGGTVAPENERARGYLEARLDRAELLRCCTAMEKLDNAQLLEVVTAAEELAVKLVSDRRELLALEAFLRRAEEYLRLNVGPKHVTGYLSTYLPDGK